MSAVLSQAQLPRIIQGGMGVAVSAWPLARAVSTAGQLGVVSGTALDVVCTRRLQRGDPGGHVRRALAAFPIPGVADWIVGAYYVEGGIDADTAYRQVPRHTLDSGRRVLELSVAANFVEVFLAKEGHDGLVGVNYLRKIDLPLPASLYGAILAGVDYVLVGAGSPADLPGLVRGLTAGERVGLPIRVQGAGTGQAPEEVLFDPQQLWAQTPPQDRPELTAPKVLAIVASTDLARFLAEDERTRPDGFVIEGPSAGGHNAPPRGPRRVDEDGQPVYGPRDEVDLAALAALGLPFWLAGSHASPQAYRAARAEGAAGVQVGTAFAFSDDSGFAPEIVAQVRAQVRAGDLRVRADWRVSPTGFPFRLAELPGTLSDPEVLAARRPVCDLGVLRSPVLRPDGKVDYRCPAEPLRAYTRKGGREGNVQGRMCLCNALFASAGLPQRRPGGALEPPLVTAGGDMSAVAALLQRHPGSGYSAQDVIDYLLG